MGFDHPQLYSLALGTSAVAAYFDLRWRRIPNWLTGPALISAYVLQLCLGGWTALAQSVLASMLAGGVFFIFFITGGMGGGDVKLIAVASACLGTAQTPSLLFLTALTGGAMAIVVVMVQRSGKQVACNISEIARHHRREGLRAHSDLNVANANVVRLPYGVAIAIGVALVCISQWKG